MSTGGTSPLRDRLLGPLRVTPATLAAGALPPDQPVPPPPGGQAPDEFGEGLEPGCPQPQHR